MCPGFRARLENGNNGPRLRAPADYTFVVGEAGLATAGRRLLGRQGLPKSRITFKGFWKHR
ncbi:MAG: SIP domain-containing protein [Bifidobacteriaceae bacterium]|nr:SIP domain-containing protein [Bifidobacteriaceae bacterium]